MFSRISITKKLVALKRNGELVVLDLKGRGWTRRLFTYSLAYVALLFALFAVSPFIS